MNLVIVFCMMFMFGSSENDNSAFNRGPTVNDYYYIGVSQILENPDDLPNPEKTVIKTPEEILDDNPFMWLYKNYYIDSSDEEMRKAADEVVESQPDMGRPANKRSGRYYRQYPGKRQRSRLNSDVFECLPNNGEKVKLLYGLHQMKHAFYKGPPISGNNLVICNRRRSLKEMVSNPRYVGKRNIGYINY